MLPLYTAVLRITKGHLCDLDSASYGDGVYVGMARLTLVIPEAHSLKEKRMVLRRIKDRVRERLGITLSEVGALDRWQRAELGVAVASGERQQVLELVESAIRVVAAEVGGQLVAIAKDAIRFEAPDAPPVVVDDRTGSGDKAVGQGDDDWIPEAWRDELDR